MTTWSPPAKRTRCASSARRRSITSGWTGRSTSWSTPSSIARPRWTCWSATRARPAACWAGSPPSLSRNWYGSWSTPIWSTRTIRESHAPRGLIEQGTMSDIIFGTDGWRGSIAEDYTFDNVRRCAQGFADYLKATYPRRTCAGHGGRRRPALPLGGLCGGGGGGAGGQRHPGPLLRRRRAHAGHLVRRHRASRARRGQHHRQPQPAQDNGFKVRDPNGGAIEPDGLKEIEARIPANAADVKHMELRGRGRSRA